MKILFVTSQSDLPEIELCIGLRKLGLQLSWLGSKNSLHQGRLIQADMPIFYQEFNNRFDLKALKFLYQHFKNNRYDIVHAFNARALTLLVILSYFFKFKLVTYRGTMGHLSKWDPASRFSYLHKNVSAIVCVSDAVKNYLENLGLAKNKLVRIYKGHDVNWYKPEEPTDLSKFSVPDKAFVVTSVAAMRPVKGIDTLLEAAILLEAFNSIHFLLVGDVRDEKILRLSKDPRLAGRVHFTGRRPDPVAIVKSCNVAVMASKKREGLPKAIIEAMSVKVPVIVTDVGGMPELVLDKQQGLIVPANDPKKLAEAISFLFKNQNLATQMGIRGCERIENFFNIKQTIEQHHLLYKQLAAEI